MKNTLATFPAVLLLVLALAPPAAAQEWFGLHHTFLGNARPLSAPLWPGQLTLSNIGASGDDGVRVDVQGLHGMAFGIRNADAMPAGASRRYVGLDAAGRLLELAERRTSLGVEFAADFGGGSRSVELYLNGAMIARLRGHVGAWDAVVLDDPAAAPVDRIVYLVGTHEDPPANTVALTYFRVYSVRPTSSYLLPDGRLVIADELIVRSETLPPAPLLDVSLFGRDTGPIRIRGEAVRFSDAKMAAVGDVSMTESGGELAVRHGSGATSGGVAVLHGPFEKVQASLDGLTRPPLAPPGCALELTARDADGDPLMTLDATIQGGDIDVVADLRPAGAQRARIELYRAGHLVASASGLPFDRPQCALGGWPRSASMLAPTPSGSGVELLFGAGGNDVILPTPTGPLTYRADAVRIVSDGPPLPGAWIESVEIMTRLDPAFSVTDVITVAPVAPRPFPGTAEDLALWSTDPASGELSVDCCAAVPAGAPLEIYVDSLDGTFDLAALLLIGDTYFAGAPNPPLLPGIWVGSNGFIVAGTPGSPLGRLLLPPSGFSLTFSLPPSMIGLSLRLQALVLSAAARNGLHAATDAHELTVTG